ncbi:hypothetical protein BAY61_21770 [Prauserella marina]|uniref:Uncharacterized protein n=1 Tax=Prauserella marina TaxID=530584 RepID=A0A222VTC7_9PSEU|nr:hypothetical protein [Prauserella marina]ASR37187.1 hypothetical protein BAY61_21770 [Prauserella marina]PWV72499.1 hypothetical protein DES30_11098 [Prauserella marina]SDD78586.1 hypothetical protein SAMN05421630_112140 [Prauserella marina]
MSAKITRRVGVVAGLVLLPAIALGGTAVAASADSQPARSQASQTQQVDLPEEEHKIKVRGELSKIEKRGDTEWGEVTVVSVVSHPGAPGLDFVLTPDSVVEFENGTPEAGDEVTASGDVQKDGKTVLADHVVFH